MGAGKEAAGACACGGGVIGSSPQCIKLNVGTGGGALSNERGGGNVKLGKPELPTKHAIRLTKRKTCVYRK